MPGFDGTGPRGEGPMTGWGRGFCNPATVGRWPYYGPGFRRGFGRGRGRGRGPGRGMGRGWGLAWRAPYPAWSAVYGPGYDPYPGDPSQELNMLKSEAEALRRDLEEVNSRIGELEKEASSSNE